jgi:hypothetical protein
MCVCPPLITFEPLGRLYEIWYGDNAIQADLEAIIFNAISSTILKWLRFSVGLGLFNCCVIMAISHTIFR